MKDVTAGGIESNNAEMVCDAVEAKPKLGEEPRDEINKPAPHHSVACDGNHKWSRCIDVLANGACGSGDQWDEEDDVHARKVVLVRVVVMSGNGVGEEGQWSFCASHFLDATPFINSSAYARALIITRWTGQARL